MTFCSTSRVCELRGNHGTHGSYTESPVIIKQYKNHQPDNFFTPPTTRKISWNIDSNIKYSRKHSHLYTKNKAGTSKITSTPKPTTTNDALKPPCLYYPQRKGSSKITSTPTPTTNESKKPPCLYYRQRKGLDTRRATQELIRKTGDCNVTFDNLNKRRSRYLQDLYTTLVDVQWRWTLLVFFMAFILSWLVFAFIWYMIITVHGDKEIQEDDDNGTQPCISNVRSFTGAFLFSIETQHTIGYGYRFITEECPEAVFILCIQSITGVILQAFMVGVVFAKLTRPKQRTNTILFSRNALVCLRDGCLSLIFRVGDMRKSFVIGAQIRAQVIKQRITLEGEVIPFHQYELSVGCDDNTSDLFFIWPMTIVHTINPQSPFYTMSAVDLMNEQFELVVFLEGTTESTGTTMQARYSYQPSDILWGHRFENLIYFDKSSDNYVIDFRQFNKTKEVSTPLCSAKDLDEFRALNTDPLICYSPANSEQIVCLEPEMFNQMEVRVDN